MNKIKLAIELTFSKIIALLVLLFGGVLSFYLKDSGIFIATLAAVSTLIVGKQVTDIKKPSKSE
jgi:hypothetical protein